MEVVLAGCPHHVPGFRIRLAKSARKKVGGEAQATYLTALCRMQQLGHVFGGHIFPRLAQYRTVALGVPCFADPALLPQFSVVNGHGKHAGTLSCPCPADNGVWLMQAALFA